MSETNTSRVGRPCPNCGVTLNGWSGLRYCGHYTTHAHADCISNLRHRAKKAEAERDQALARLAAAYEAAAQDCATMADQVANAAITGLPEQARLRESMEAAFTKAAGRIRALTPADAQAALDKLLTEARLDEQERCVRAVETARNQQRQAWLEGKAVDLDFARMVIAHIRALPEPKEASHE